MSAQSTQSGTRAAHRLGQRADIDWSQANVMIAAQCGVSEKTVRRARMAYGKPASTRRANTPPLAGDSVDWSKTNRELAVRYGVTRKSVERYRIRHNKPKSAAAQTRDASHRAGLTVLDTADLAKTVKEIAGDVGCSRNAVLRARKAAGISRTRCAPKTQAPKTQAPKQATPKPKPVEQQPVAAQAVKDLGPWMSPAERLRRAREAWLGY